MKSPLDVLADFDNSLERLSAKQSCNVNELMLDLADTKAEKKLARDIIEQHHSYVSSSATVGRRMDYLIKCIGSGEAVGMVGVGNIPLGLTALNKYIGWTRETKNKKVGCEVANLYRHTIMDSAPLFTGTKSLKLLKSNVAKDWKDKYGDVLRLLATTVVDDKRGIIYIASGWDNIGKTKGGKCFKTVREGAIDKALEDGWVFESSKQISRKGQEGYKLSTLSKKCDSARPKHIFIKPLRRNAIKSLKGDM